MSMRSRLTALDKRVLERSDGRQIMSKRQGVIIIVALALFGVTLSVLGVRSGYVPVPVAVVTPVLGLGLGYVLTRHSR